MTAREQLAAVLSPSIVEAIQDLIAERVAAELASREEASSPWLSIADGADYLGVARRTIEREISRGRLKPSAVGRRRLLHPPDLDRLAAGEGGDSANRSTSPAAAT